MPCLCKFQAKFALKKSTEPRAVALHDLWLVIALVTTAPGLTPCSLAAEKPVVSFPRATSGDMAFEPDWTQRITVSVGPTNADIVGVTDRALQAAVDYVTRLGGGTVRI